MVLAASLTLTPTLALNDPRQVPLFALFLFPRRPSLSEQSFEEGKKGRIHISTNGQAESKSTSSAEVNLVSEPEGEKTSYFYL